MCHICYFDWKDVVIVSVGPNLVHVSELENFLRLEDNKDLDNRGVKLKNDIDRHGGVVAIVYWYKSDGSYDGEGTACIKCRNGTWFVMDLGHCSCYEPLDPNDCYVVEVAVDELISPESVHDIEIPSELRKKLAEIVDRSGD